MPRVLLVGRGDDPLRTEYAVKEAFWRLGFEVKVFDDVKIASWVGEALTNHIFKGVLGRWDPDLVYFSKALHLRPETISYASEVCPTAMWYLDSRRTMDRRILERAKRVRYFFTVSRGDAEGFRAEGVRAFHLPQGYYIPELPGTLSQEESSSELAFVGNNNGGEYRLKFLKFLGKRYELTVWGEGWDALRGSCRVPGRRAIGEDYRMVCRNSKIILGLHSFLWTRGRTCTVSNRLWNTLACGGFLLYQETRGFDLLEDGKHFVSFSGIGDAKEKIDYYLSHEEERRRISSEGQREALENHSYTSRVRDMLEVLSLCPS